MPVLDTVFQQIAALLLVAAVVGVLARMLHQPLVVAFIGVGVVAGPAGLGIVEAAGEIELLAEIGIALLLFVVGLKLDLHLVRSVGPVAVAVGLAQVLLSSGIGFGLARLLGYGAAPSLYIAIALAFSSTIIVVKLLSDRKEIDELHGRVALGVLIVQDIVVVLVMIAVSATADGAGLAVQFAAVLAKGVAFLLAVWALSRWVLPRLLHRVAAVPELLLVFSIAWAVVLAAAGDFLGFTEEVGAFVAGVALAATPYRDAIGSRLTGLRDFLVLFFFISLGAQLDFGDAGAQLGAAALLSLFVLIGKPLIVMAIMGGMGYRKRVGFRSGVALAQISEFSLILVALGVELGHVDSALLSFATLVGLATIGLSSYFVAYSDGLYRRLAPLLSVFERARTPGGMEQEPDAPDPTVIVFGLGRYGGNILLRLHREGVAVLGVDFDPAKLRNSARHGIPVRYGDAEDPDFPDTLPLSRCQWIVSATPRTEPNLALAHALRHHGYAGRLALTAHWDEDASRIEAVGPDLILRPFKDAAQRAVDQIAAEVPRQD